jgi:hypothetical protein
MPDMNGRDISKAVYSMPKNIYKDQRELGGEQVLGSEQDEREAICYTINGTEVEEKNSQVYAKIVRVNSSVSHYILFTPHGKMFNPHGLYDGDQVTRQSQGKKPFLFRKVNEKAFNLYYEFLRTRNPSWLQNAERECA